MMEQDKVKISGLLRHIAQRLEGAGVESARAEANALLGHLLGLSHAELWLRRGRTLTPRQLQRLDAWVSRRERREPLQHILGMAHFYGLALRVTEQVLIPRPETERLVELALENLKTVRRPKVLDVGTGGGAIALALKAERPDAVVLATDVSLAALEVAQQNAAQLGLDVRFAHSNLLGAPEVRTFARSAHLLVSNPPYLPESDRNLLSPEVRADPETALFAGPDGLGLFRILERQAYGLLQGGAHMFVELDPRNVTDASLFARGWSEKALHADLVGRTRFLQLRR